MKPQGGTLTLSTVHPDASHPGFSFLGAGWSSPVARQAHNLKVAGSNPAPATNIQKNAFTAIRLDGGFFVSSGNGGSVIPSMVFTSKTSFIEVYV